MARTNATNFSGALQFPYATAATDLFVKEDVQTLALAVDQHDHTSGKGLALGAVDIGDWFRSTGHTTPFSSLGAGVEMYYDATNKGFLQTYNRAAGAYETLTLNNTLVLPGNGTASMGGTLSTGALTTSGLTVNGSSTMNGTLQATAQINANSFQTNN